MCERSFYFGRLADPDFQIALADFLTAPIYSVESAESTVQLDLRTPVAIAPDLAEATAA